MGYDILFVKKFPDGELDYKERDVPEVFTNRFADREDWHFAMLDVDYEMIDNDFSSPGAWRPTNFVAFRALLKERDLWRKPFRCMTRWLERHPDIYLSFNN